MVKKTQSAYDTIKHGIPKTWQSLVITHKSERLREPGLLGGMCATDPERSEGSLADLWRITEQSHGISPRIGGRTRSIVGAGLVPALLPCGQPPLYGGTVSWRKREI